MYFRLNNTSYIVKGCNSTIYSLGENKCFILDKVSSQILNNCEENCEIERLNIEDCTEKSIFDFLKRIEELGLGSFHENKIHVDKYRYNTTRVYDREISFIPKYKIGFLELTDRCNLECTFCGINKVKTWSGCTSCVNDYYNENKLIDIDLLSLINEFKDINLENLIIKGGNPLLYLDKISTLLVTANNVIPDMGIIINTNGTGVSIEQILKLYKMNSNLMVNIVLFGMNNNDYEGLTGNKDIINQQYNILDKLKESNLLFSISVVLNETTINTGEDIIKYIKKRWNKTPQMSQSIECDINNLKELDHIVGNKKYISEFESPKQFFTRKKHNTCLLGKFAINKNGEVNPCPHINDNLGDLNIESLNTILGREELYDYWHLSKEKVDICRECPMNSYCSDCSVFEIEKNLHEVYCPYNKNDIKDIYSINFQTINNNFIEKVSLVTS